MSANQYYGYTNPKTRYIGDSFAGNAKWNGIALAYTGNLYCAPSSANRVLKINPHTGETTLIGPDLSTRGNKFFGITAHQNNKLYCAPYGEDWYLEIDPATDAVSLIPTAFNACRGVAVHPNGKLYSWRGGPYGGTLTPVISGYSKLVEFDPATGFSQLVGTDDLTDSAGNGLAGSILGKDNKIYCGVRNKRRIYSYDPVTDTVEMKSLADIGGNNSHWGGMAVVQQNRKIYYAGYIDQSFTNTIDIDSRVRTVADGRQPSATSGGGRNSAVAQAPNGRLFLSPLNNNRVLAHSIEDNIDYPFGMGLGEGVAKYAGIATAGNGRLYCAPYNAPRVLEIYGVGEFSSFNEVYGFTNGEPTTYMRGL